MNEQLHTRIRWTPKQDEELGQAVQAGFKADEIFQLMKEHRPTLTPLSLRGRIKRLGLKPGTKQRRSLHDLIVANRTPAEVPPEKKRTPLDVLLKPEELVKVTFRTANAMRVLHVEKPMAERMLSLANTL